MTDERPHTTAILAVVNAELDSREAYLRGKVPGLDGNTGTEPAIYAVVDLLRRNAGTPLRSVRTDRRGWRVTVIGVGRTVAEAQWVLAEISTALEGVALLINGGSSSPLIYDGGRAIAPDKGRYSGALSWTYGTF